MRNEELVVVAKHYRNAQEIRRDRCVWIKDAEFPKDVEVGAPIKVVRKGKKTVVAMGVIDSIARFTDLAPVGAGRHRDDVYVRVELS